MISIIIPTLNEAPRIGALVRLLRAQDPAAQIVVADGGSTDGTLAIAREAGADHAITAERGRGQQLVAGLALARGTIIWFLHADTALPDGALAAITRTLDANPASPGGNFRLLFDGNDGFSRWLDGFYAWLRRRGWYYGDSGIFIRRSVLDRIGGLRPLTLMEDYDLVRRLERAGPTLCIADPPLLTSSRRFAGRKPAAIIWGWIRIHLRYYCGTNPERLAALYDSERRG